MLSKIEISHRTIIFTVVFLLSLWLLFSIRDIILLMFIAFIIMSALRPTVDWLASYRIPRVLSIFLIYALVFGLFGFVIAQLIPSFSMQSAKLTELLPSFVSRVMPYWNVDVSSVTQQIAPISENILRVTLGIFSNVMTILTVLVFTFYLLLEHKKTEIALAGFIGEPAAEQVLAVLEKIEKRLGSWVQGELILMFFIGIFSYIGLFFLHMEFALPLAIIAGILEIVPTIGPIISAVPAILVALSVSPALAVYVAILYVIIQQVENNLIVPLVMKKSVGLSPLVTIFALLVGARLAGILGAILSVPIVLLIQELLPIALNRRR